VTNNSWRPGASLEVLKRSAELRACIRHYMCDQNVLEVITPALSIATTTDPNIHSFQVADHYLHTSPEFAMKRLLAAYTTDIYQMATVFRDGESGRFHNPEFTLLEWYRVGMNHHALMGDVSALLRQVFEQFDLPWISPKTVRYTDAVSAVCDKPFNETEVIDIERVFSQHQRSYPSAIGDNLDAALDLLIDEFVKPDFNIDCVTYLVDYPASQAALARISKDHNQLSVAERFEVYWGAVELANGFHELADAIEQRARFEHEQRVREQRGERQVPLDENLLSALTHGLPDCAGVALGLDRLMLVLAGAEHIDEVIAFSGVRA